MGSSADSAVQWGLSQIGVTYRTGAAFTHMAYHVVGFDIPKTAVAQAFRGGLVLPNPRRNLAPGDLVFPTTRIAQLYVGGGFVLTVTKAGVARYPVRRVWRAVRVTTPGGGVGLNLAQPTVSPPVTYAGKRRGSELG